MRRAYTLRGPAWAVVRQPQPSSAASALAGSTDGVSEVLLHVRRYAQPAPAAGEAGAPPAQTNEDEDLRLMQAVLSRVGPPAEMREAHRTNDVQRLRFGDLPATMSWMESFVGSGTSGGYSSTGNPGPQSGDAIYDVPAWLEANVPSHDTSPKSPVYHWVSWMEAHLPPDQKRLYLALHEHLRDEPRRQAIMAKAQYELACLWDWQHRRVAAGLPHSWTPQEEEAARKAAIAQAEKEAQALQATATSARARAASEASVAAGGRPTLPSHATAGSGSSSAVLKAQQGPQQHQHGTKTTAGSSGSPSPAAAAAPVALVREAATVWAHVFEAEAAVADAQRWLIQDPSSSAMLPDMQDALLAARSAAEHCTAAAHEGNARALQEAATEAEQAQAIAVRMAAAVAPHWVGTQHADAATSGKAGTPGAKSTATAKQASSRTPTGISMFLKQAEQRKELEEQQRKEARVKLSQQLGLSGAEQALAKSLNMDLQELLQRAEGNEVAGSSREVGLQPLLSAFQARIGGGKKQMAAGSNARAVSLMRGAFEQRAREEADATDALSLLGSDRATSQPGSGTQNARVPLVGSTGLAAQAKLALKKAREAQQKQAQEQGHPQAADASAEKDMSLFWSQLPVFNHESTLKRMAGMKHDKELVVQGKLLADSQVLDLGSPPPYCPDPLYRTPYQFNLHVRPPTATLDLVLDYMQVKYQDVLLRRDLTQRVCVQLAPPTPRSHTPSTPSTPSPSSSNTPQPSTSSTSGAPQPTPQGSSSSPTPSHTAASTLSSSPSSNPQQKGSAPVTVSHGHWSGRLSLPDVAKLNELAGQLFEEGWVPEYRSLVRQLAGLGLMTQAELAEHEAAAQLRADELHASRAAGASSPTDQAAVSPALQAHLLQGLTGTGSGAVGFGTSHSLGTLEQARAAWEGASTPSGYAAWAASMSDSASSAAAAGALTAAAKRPAPQQQGPGAAAPGAAPAASASGAQQQPGTASASGAQQQPGTAEAVRSWWAGPGAAAPSFEEARTAWQQYVEMAGNPADAPQLESVLLADQELRAAKAAAASDPNAQARVASAQANADALNAAIARLFQGFVAHTGSATVPLPGKASSSSSGSHTPSGSTSSSPPQSALGGARSSADDLWRAVAERNAALNPVAEHSNNSSSGSGSVQGLLSMFKGALTVPDLLRAHWERVGRVFLRTQLAWGSAPGWDQLWSLMTVLHRQLSSSTPTAATPQAAAKRPAAEGQQRQGGSDAAPHQPAAPYAAAGLSPASRELLSSKYGKPAAAPQPPQSQPRPTTPAGQPGSKSGKADSPDASLDPQFLATVGPAKPPTPEELAAQAAAAALADEKRQAQQWQQYMEAQEERANFEAAQGAQWPVTSQLAPPYPGARRIVRFQQSIVLGPASALSSTQGLAEKLAAREASDAAHPATFGLGSPPALLPDHPASRRVTMRVNLSDLAQEMGLSQKALKRMQLVAGPSRYSPATGDLTLVCALHPSREENRRWCLERLHMMAADAHAAHPAQGGLGLRGLRATWD